MRHILIVRCERCGYEGMGKITAESKDSPGWFFHDPKCPRCHKPEVKYLASYDFHANLLADLGAGKEKVPDEVQIAWSKGFECAEQQYEELIKRIPEVGYHDEFGRLILPKEYDEDGYEEREA